MIPMFRRALFPLIGSAAALATVAKAETPVFDSDTYGLRVSLCWRYGGWHVAVPAQDTKWIPGHPIAIDYMPLAEYLSAIETEVFVNG